MSARIFACCYESRCFWTRTVGLLNTWSYADSLPVAQVGSTNNGIRFPRGPYLAMRVLVARSSVLREIAYVNYAALERKLYRPD